MFWQRLMELCKEKGTRPNPVASLLGISSGAVTKWKNGTIPNGNTLQVLADYFGVSVDYLIGNTDVRETKKPAGISDELWEAMQNNPRAVDLLELLLKMSPEQMEQVEKAIDNNKK